MHFCKLICRFLVIYFQVHMSKISAKSDEFFLSYSNVFLGPLLSGHSVSLFNVEILTTYFSTSRLFRPKFIKICSI